MFKVDRRYIYIYIETDVMLDEVDKRCVHVYICHVNFDDLTIVSVLT